jgi:hypothetical protein
MTGDSPGARKKLLSLSVTVSAFCIHRLLPKETEQRKRWKRKRNLQWKEPGIDYGCDGVLPFSSFVNLVLAASSFCRSSVLFWLPYWSSVEQLLSWDGGITLILHNYLQGLVLVLVFLLPFVLVLLSRSLSSSRRRYLELKEVELYHYPHHWINPEAESWRSFTFSFFRP